MRPDYSLYPDMDYDLGRTTLGCIRNCYFCIVPKKEGAFRRHQHPREFHHPDHKKTVLIDNNILADRDWFLEVTDWVLGHHMKVDFNQGLDLRLMTQEYAERIAELKPVDYWHFAFDSMAYRPAVERGLGLLKKAGVNIRNKANVYVYCHDDASVEDAVERCNILKAIGTTPYIMLNRNTEQTQRMKDLRRWSRPWLFHTCTYEEYRQGIGHERRQGQGQTSLDGWATQEAPTDA